MTLTRQDTAGAAAPAGENLDPPALLSRLHFRSGSILDVFELPDHAAQLLCGAEPGDGGREMGYVAVQNSHGTHWINPAAVERVEDVSGRQLVERPTRRLKPL